ncbi:alpha/beta fold hydrolase [Streptomyces sp. Da 82-17]|uniref:alpha/beta fold hydrolase n=1 Tax=Streptomyces sp. Da 82-17 TaxID=3377116 RepID=UPI0038D3E54D
MPVRRVAVRGAELEVDERGAGEPVLLVQTALTADELQPLAEHPALAAGHRTILCHRRGYAGSSPADGPGSVNGDAADCVALLDALGVERAHVLGYSYSAAVALQLAADAPHRTHTLVLLEPPPVHTASAPEFRAVNDRLRRTRREHGPAAALDELLTLVTGPDWREVFDARLPGSVRQMERDTATFFDTDVPALLAWRFGPADARRITCPALHVGGTDSGPWFAETRALVHAWLPHAEDVQLPGANHSFTLTHTDATAHAVADFLRRNPMPT